MSDEIIPLNGYAITYAEIAAIGDGWEVVARQAFGQMLAARDPVDLRFWHEGEPAAHTADGTLVLFSDQFGLGFESKITLGAGLERWQLRAIVHGGSQFCSVNFIEMLKGRRQLADGTAARVIVSAKIDHIAIVDSSAAYKRTAIWRADCDLSQAPARIQQMADRWRQGRARSRTLAAIHGGNPNHDPNTGEFSEGGGAAGGNGPPTLKERVASTSKWLRDTPARDVITTAAKSHTGKEVLTFAVGSLIAHGFGSSHTGGGFWYSEPPLEQNIEVIVHNISSHLMVTTGQASAMLKTTIGGLKKLREKAAGTTNKTTAMVATASDDDMLPSVDHLQAILNGIDSFDEIQKAAGDAAKNQAKVRALLAPRQAYYAAVRAQFAQSLRMGSSTGPEGQIMAHVAFTSVGGFDGNFDRLLTGSGEVKTGLLNV